MYHLLWYSEFLNFKTRRLTSLMISQNHRMVCVGRDFKIHLVPASPATRDTFHYTRLLQSPTHLALNISREMEHPQLTFTVSDMLYIWALRRKNKVAVPSRIKTFHQLYPWCFACLFSLSWSPDLQFSKKCSPWTLNREKKGGIITLFEGGCFYLIRFLRSRE